MALRDQIMADIKTAMKSKDQIRLDTLRFLNSAIKNREIEMRPNAITEDEIILVLKKAVKQRNESIEQFQQAGRADLVEKEQGELKVLSEYLPQQMDRAQIEKIVTAVMQDLSANSLKMMGAVIKEVITRSKGAADNKLISEIVKAKLVN